MTPAELDAMLAGRPIARAAGACFFTTYDRDEAERYAAHGARLRPLPGPGRSGHEVLVAYMLDASSETDEDGNELDLRPALALAHFRERDGFAVPSFAIEGGGRG